MAEWVSHLIVADRVLEKLPQLSRHEFCVGNIAPDYIDYLPKGAIPMKVKMMYYMPTLEVGRYPFVGFSREEYDGFLERAVNNVINAIETIVMQQM